MTTYQDILNKLGINNASSGDSDETTIIVYMSEDEINRKLEGMDYEIYPHTGYAGGTIIVPKEK